MLYNIFYYLLKFSCYLYFRKIRFYQAKNIPSQNPLIICANHGNSFMDAVLIAINFKRKLYFLARADVFNSPLKRWFLSQINMMPIYRIRDGREEVKNNDAIFKKCSHILENNGAILIFPEGTCVVEKRLRTFKNGFVQLAFKANAVDLKVLPITINYSKPLAFYTEVDLSCANPIAVTPIKKNTKGDYIKFSKTLITQVNERIKVGMVTIADKNDDEFYEQILELTRNDVKQNFLFEQINVIKYLNEVKINNLLLYNELKEKSKSYFNNTNRFKIDDEAVKSINNYNKNLLFFVYPFYFSGLIIHYLPTVIINYIVNRKIKEMQFISAVRLVFGMFAYLIYIPIIFILFSKLLFFGSIFLFGLLYFYYANFHQIKLFLQIKKMKKLNINFREQRNELVSLLNP